MKKILSFLLLGLMCSIVNLWAVDPDVSVTSMTESTASTYFKTYNDGAVTLLQVGGYAEASSYYYATIDKTDNTGYVGVTSTICEIDSVSFLITGNGKNKQINAGLIGYDTVTTYATPNFFKAEYATNYPRTGQIPTANYSDAIWATFDLSDKNLKAVYIAKQWKNVVVGTASKASFPSSNAQSSFIYGVKVWLRPGKTISYNANGGTGTMTNSINYVSANGFTAPTGSVFDGWNTQADGEGTSYAVGAKVNSDITLYAQWRLIQTFTVTYDAATNGGSCATASAQYTDGGVELALPAATKTNYDFLGWYDAATAGNKIGNAGDSYVPSSNITLYAQFKLHYDAIFSLAIGTIASDKSMKNTDPEYELTGTEATVSGGQAFVGCINKDNKQVLASAGTIKLAGNDSYVKLVLSQELREGDMISFTGGDIQMGFTIDNTLNFANTEPKIKSTNGSYTIETCDAIRGLSTICIWRATASSTAWKTITISRPANSTANVSHTVTFNSNGGSTVAAQSILSGCTATEPADPTKAGFVFEGWQLNGVDYDFSTAVTANITLAAVWTAAHTVTYMDDESVLGSETVIDGNHPTKYASYQTKSYYSFAGWYNNADLAEEHKIADISALTITANATFYGKWNKAYASSVNIEQLVLDNGKSYDIMSQLGALGYTSNMSNDLDSLDDTKTNRNYAYLGQKAKAQDKLLNFCVAAGQTVKVKFGNIGDTTHVSINGGSYAKMAITGGIYTYTADAEATISIKTISGKTVVFKQIMIDEDIQDVVLPVSDEFTLGTNGYSTYANKFKYTVTGATVYKAKVNTNKDAVVLTALDANAVIPANTGIILKGTEGETVTIMATDNNATTISENDLLGTTAEIDAPTNAYVISTNVVNEVNVTAFNPCGAELKIPAHKAYLVIEGANPQAAPIRIIMEGQNATNIENLEGAEEAVKFIENGKLYIMKNGVVYDAMGKTVR